MTADGSRPSRQRSRALTPAAARRWLLAPAALGLALGAAHALRPAAWLGGGPLSDDAFYALAVARHAALGHGLSVDGATATDGFQPLWVLLHVPVYALAGGDRVAPLRVALLAATALWCALAALVARAARDDAEARGRDGALAWALGLTAVLGSYAVFRTCHNGLETALHLVALALAARRLDAEARRAPALRGALATGALLGLACYARLDAALFVAAAGALALRDVARGRRPWLPALLPYPVAGALLAPWLARSVALHGHPMPTSGRAEAVYVDLARNATATLAAAGQALAAPVARLPLWHPTARAGAALVGVAALALAARRARAHWRGAAHGGRALAAYLAATTGYYTLAFGAPHFQDRYLAPALLVALPWLASAVAGALAPRPRRGTIATGVALAVVNGAGFAFTLGPAGLAANPTYHQQTAWTLARVAPGCVVGALQTGALGYFRERVVNLDGKVNRDALRALEARALRRYVDAAGVDVVIDWPSLTRIALGPARAGFVRVGRAGAFEAWAREGRAGRCVLPEDAATTPEAVAGRARAGAHDHGRAAAEAVERVPGRAAARADDGRRAAAEAVEDVAGRAGARLREGHAAAEAVADVAGRTEPLRLGARRGERERQRDEREDLEKPGTPTNCHRCRSSAVAPAPLTAAATGT